MGWHDEIDDRYTNREQAIVDYLSSVLDSKEFEVSRLLSVTTTSGECPFVVLVRFLGTKTAASPTMNRHTDTDSFEIVGIPLASTDDDANDACNYIEEKIIEAVRTGRAHDVFGEEGGKALLWYVSGSIKGDNDEGNLAIAIQVEAEFQEDYSGTVPSKTLPGLDLGTVCSKWRLVEPTRKNPVMTSNTAPSGVASASTIIGGGYEAWRAFNGGIATGSGDWVAKAATFPSWLQYQFAAEQVIKSYRITTRGEPGYPIAPKSWTLAGSNDGTNWTTLDTQTNITSWSATVMRTMTFGLPNNTTAYTHYRLTITAGNQNYAAVGELELYEDLPVVAPSERVLLIGNPGERALTISSAVVPSWLSLSGLPATVPAEDTASLTVVVEEEEAGSYEGEIELTTSCGLVKIPVKATILTPE